MNSASKFNSTVVKTLKLVLCSSCGGFLQNSKKLCDNIVHQYGDRLSLVSTPVKSHNVSVNYDITIVKTWI